MKLKIPSIVAAFCLLSAIMIYSLSIAVNSSGKELQALSLVVFTIGFWASGALPEYLTALIFLLAASVLKIAPIETIFSGFHSKALWLVFGGLIISVAVKRTGLGSRLANRLVDVFGGSYLGVICSIVIISMLFAFFIPSTMGRVLLVVPISLAMADHLRLAPGSAGRNGIVMAATLACYVPSCAVLPSNVPNMVLIGASESIYHLTFSYTDYLRLHYPVIGFLKAIAIIVLTPLLYPSETQRPPLQSKKEHHPASNQEIKLGFVLIGTLIIWGTDFLHGVSPAWVALGAAIICLLPSVALVPTDVFTQKVNFGLLFYVAGVLGLGAVVASTGLGNLFGKALLNLIDFHQHRDLRNFFSLVFISTGLSTITTVASLPAVMTPFAGDLAGATGFPLETVLMTQVIGFSTPLLPYQVPPLVVGMQLGGVSATQGARLTLALAAVSFLVLIPLNYFWWWLLGAFTL